MPEYSYIDLACKVLEVDPQSILAFHEYDENLAIITSEGKKYIFSFDELEDYHQYSQDNEPEKVTQEVKSSKINSEKSTRSRSKSSVANKSSSIAKK